MPQVAELHRQTSPLNGVLPRRPPQDVIAAEIVEDLRAALEQFAEIQADLTRPT